MDVLAISRSMRRPSCVPTLAIRIVCDALKSGPKPPRLEWLICALAKEIMTEPSCETHGSPSAKEPIWLLPRAVLASSAKQISSRMPIVQGVDLPRAFGVRPRVTRPKPREGADYARKEGDRRGSIRAAVLI